MNRKIKKALNAAFISPKPTRKTVFLNSLPYPKTTIYQFFISQLGYIRKRFWCFSILLLVSMVAFFIQIEQGKEIVGILSSMLPILTLLASTEINKSMAFNMSELEASCKYNLNMITLIRLSVIGVFHLLILILALLIFKEKSQYGLLRYALYAVTPFLLSSYFSFWLTNHLKTENTIYICSGVTVFISLSVFIINSNYTLIYNPNYTLVWEFAFVTIGVLLIKEIHFLINERIRQWNFA